MEFFGELGDKKLRFYIAEQSKDVLDELAYVFLLKSRYSALLEYHAPFFDEKERKVLHLELSFSSYEEFAEAKARANSDTIGTSLSSRARDSLNSVDRNRRMASGLLQKALAATN
ncbi:hypothetical protein [Neorhizobium galegae]|uniref:Uncharacterized protein n=1 Tax=Neorhizobium galegae bv. officinalis TaxID=323656 RepID=A0A0T7GYK1_NEOGA|nr:hypothetical protein [Neorhizobium galegae]CDZ52325.1 Hypothetical protein NGAL_HAMBI1189_44270 [Neorhizobium galegae bv. officinalis]